MVKISEAIAMVDLTNIIGNSVKSYTKYLKELDSFFLNESEAINSKDIAYEVYSISLKDAGSEALQYGLTVMNPLTVNNECVMTRGHFHENREYGEIYQGLKGEGLLLKWDGKDEVIFEKVVAGSVHLIDGKHAHRLINTGNEVFSVGAIWSKNAGYNYEEIEERGFPVRVFKENGEIVVKDKNGKEKY